MNSALLGISAALAWGAHDFIGRFTSRRTGALVTTCGLVISGLVLLTVYSVGSARGWPDAGDAMLLCVLAGVSYALATLSLFAAYRIGSMSVVSPIAGSYPAVAVVFALIGGARPSVVAWLAIAAVIIGTLLVSMAGKTHEAQGHIESGKLPLVLALSGATALFFATSLLAGQAAAGSADEIDVTWFARLFALAALVPFFAVKGLRGSAPLSLWPALGLMGLLDTIAMLAVFAAGKLAFPEMAIVLGGSFGAVVTILARVFLKEPVSPSQWFGIALICCGAGVLSAGY